MRGRPTWPPPSGAYSRSRSGTLRGVEVPETRYVARADGVSIAYQVVGDGPRDLIYVPGFISHLDLQWTDPGFTRFLRRMSSFARVILFDKPGTGISDPIPHVPTAEERMGDIRTVLRAAGAERAVVMGFSEGAAAALLLAATWPDLVESLVFYGGVFHGKPTADQFAEYGIDAEDADARWAAIDGAVADWGRGRTADVFVPSAGAVERRFWGLFERAAASPRMARALVDGVKQLDVMPAAPLVAAPALLMHRTDDIAPIGASRRVAQLMPHATLVELPGEDHAFWVGDCDPIVDEIEQFITGVRRAAEPDRTLATVLFTDLVGSTRRAAELGDGAWRGVLQAHESVIRRVVTTHRGRVVKSMGDGHLSVFDGPARAIRAAMAIRDAAAEPVRAGLHTGECEVMGDDVGGLAVHIGARVGALAGPGEVLVSGTVKDLVVGSALAFVDRGEHELKGVPGAWRVYAVGAPEAPPAPIDAALVLGRGDLTTLRMARHAPSSMRTAARLFARRR